MNKQEQKVFELEEIGFIRMRDIQIRSNNKFYNIVFMAKGDEVIALNHIGGTSGLLVCVAKQSEYYNKLIKKLKGL